MWFEPPPIPDALPIGNGITSPVGFKTPPGAAIGSANHVLNDHTYCCAIVSDACIDHEPLPEKADVCLAWHKSKIGTRSADAERLGIPLFITEFGACFNEGPCSQEINQVMDVADEYLIGWSYWQLKHYGDLTTSTGAKGSGVYNPDGSLQTYKVKALARPYMQRTQGTPTAQSFDVNTYEFKFEYKVNMKILQPSIGFFSKDFYYKHGFSI